MKLLRKIIGRIKHILLVLWLRLDMMIAVPVAFLRLRSSYIVERWGEAGALQGKVCVFVHFDRRGQVHDFVLHYLAALKAAGFQTVFVSNSPRLDPISLETMRGLSVLVLRRKNVGYDFGAYKDGMSVIPDLGKVDQLLLANDSVYGPFHPIEDVLARTDMARAQFWGATDCWDIAYHLQSYFLLFGSAALEHPAFRAFWRRLRYVNSKHYVIRKYEVGLSQSLLKAGLRGMAICRSREAGQALLEAVRGGALNDEALDKERKEYLALLYRALQRGAPVNMSHALWDYLIVQLGSPFIKRELLQRNPVSVPYVARWEAVIQSVSDYDTELIVRHLERTLKNRSI